MTNPLQYESRTSTNRRKQVPPRSWAAVGLAGFALALAFAAVVIRPALLRATRSEHLLADFFAECACLFGVWSVLCAAIGCRHSVRPATIIVLATSAFALFLSYMMGFAILNMAT